MVVKLLRYTPDAEKVCAIAARQCYAPGYIHDKIDEPVTNKDKALLKKVISLGHTSILEHASYTFAIADISRITSHQLVRFRHASIAQQSQRYTFAGGDGMMILPDTIKGAMRELIYDHLVESWKLYNDLVRMDVPLEDARYILPGACSTNLVISMNAREIHHACALRCCKRAQLEIRKVFNRVRDAVKEVHPALFENLGAPCVSGPCPEGGMSCKLFKKGE